MFPTRAGQRPRQSRRSACDRCRTYKLRCERSLTGGAECERCARTAGAKCTTTPSQAPLALGNQTPPGHHQIPRSCPNEASAKSPSLYIRPAMPSPPSPDSNSCRGRTSSREQGQSSGPAAEHARGTSQPVHFGLTSPISDVFETSCMDFTLANLNFPEDGYFAPSPDMVNDIISMDDSSDVLLTPPSAHSGASSSSGPLPGMPEPNSMLELLDLSSRMVEDQQVLSSLQTPTSHGSGFSESTTDMPLHRLLDNTVYLSNLLKDLSVNDQIADQPQQPKPTDSDPSSVSAYVHILPKPGTLIPPPGERQLPDTTSAKRLHPAGDMVLTTTLITTYIILVRSWRQVFLHFLDILGSNNGTSLTSLATSLPALQLGGLHVLRNNPSMQIAVLLETSTGLIEGVEDFLGVFQKQQSSLTGAGNSCLRMMADPSSVSIREALLSQEMLRVYGIGRRPPQGHSGAISLEQTSCPVNLTLEGHTWRELVSEVKKTLG
ncbi:hypothetical protein QBC37DRAFT_466565 [Rhypophila decipiens]|uniref:Zn(2)-C6 fungal-type domain-containing protein n=1 Tax=Rhypophila decipiens TaxID=261697 RepID=A0AAN6Y543_9PEZI|nr:hypothetical protein QBC37DRAFT_466565 [Rhypophila decipiens]